MTVNLKRILLATALTLSVVPTLACDFFPSNAAITVVDGQPVVTFVPCESGERVEEIVVLQWDGDGQGDHDYFEIWHARIEASYDPDYHYPLGVTDPRYAQPAPPNASFDANGTYRVYVYTNEHDIVTGFKTSELVEGYFRAGGEDVPLTQLSDQACG